MVAVLFVSYYKGYQQEVDSSSSDKTEDILSITKRTVFGLSEK